MARPAPKLPGEAGFALGMVKKFGGKAPAAPEEAPAGDPGAAIGDEFGAMLGGGGDDAEAPVDEPEGEPTPEEGAGEGEGMAKLQEALGVDEAQAQKLYDASQTIPALQGMSPEELATKVERDFRTRMEIEKAAAAQEEGDLAMEGAEGGEPEIDMEEGL